MSPIAAVDVTVIDQRLAVTDPPAIGVTEIAVTATLVRKALEPATHLMFPMLMWLVPPTLLAKVTSSIPLRLLAGVTSISMTSLILLMFVALTLLILKAFASVTTLAALTSVPVTLVVAVVAAAAAAVVLTAAAPAFVRHCSIDFPTALFHFPSVRFFDHLAHARPRTKVSCRLKGCRFDY